MIIQAGRDELELLWNELNRLSEEDNTDLIKQHIRKTYGKKREIQEDEGSSRISSDEEDEETQTPRQRLVPEKPQFTAPRKDSIRTSSDSDDSADQTIDAKKVLIDPKRTTCDGCGASMLKRSLTRHQRISCPNQERRDNDGKISATESLASEVASGSKSRATKDAIFKVPRLLPSLASVTSQEHDRETDDEEDQTRRRNQLKRNIKFPKDGSNTLQGRDAAKKFMWQQFVRPAKNPNAVSSVTRSSGGILLYGPPGTGKTAIAKAAAAEAGYAFLKVDSSMISSHWMGSEVKQSTFSSTSSQKLIQSWSALMNLTSFLEAEVKTRSTRTSFVPFWSD